MNELGCGCAQAEGRAQDRPLGRKQRAARAGVGVGTLAVAGLTRSLSRRALARVGAPPSLAWVLAAAPAWFGASHLVAAATSYRGCPEIGAIPSFVLGREVRTTCPPWDELDQRLEPDASAGPIRSSPSLASSPSTAIP
jgi:hypothetical protein